MGNAIQQSGDSEDLEGADEACSVSSRFTFRQGLPGFCAAPSLEQVHRDAVIIFDWDDTLMCSSAIKEATPPSDAELHQLGKAVSEVLLKAIELGRTAIVTNANLSWVRASASLFLPEVLPVLQFIQIMSARQSYEERWPGDFDKWKVEAFRDVVAGRLAEVSMGINDMSDALAEECDVHASWKVLGCDFPVIPADIFGEDGLNLVVLGDSMIEMRAGSALGTSASSRLWMSSTIVKRVKFKATPTVQDLLGQLQVVAQHLQSVVDEDRNLYKKLVHGNTCGWTIKDQ
jgi:hypothetical protein